MYNEFVHNAQVHEPWNAYSSLIFFIPVFFWIWKLRGEYQHHRIIVAVLPLLFLNGLGSTLFHAFRSNPYYLILDWLPASIMSFVLTVYFWTKLVKKWYFGLAIVVGSYGLAALLTYLLTSIPSLEAFAPNIGYLFVGLTLFTPIVILLYRIKWRFLGYFLFTLLFLSLALLCRILDYPTPQPLPNLLPQGTHFLWHVFSSFAVFSLGFFVYRLNNLQRKIA